MPWRDARGVSAVERCQGSFDRHLCDSLTNAPRDQTASPAYRNSALRKRHPSWPDAEFREPGDIFRAQGRGHVSNVRVMPVDMSPVLFLGRNSISPRTNTHEKGILLRARRTASPGRLTRRPPFPTSRLHGPRYRPILRTG